MIVFLPLPLSGLSISLSLALSHSLCLSLSLLLSFLLFAHLTLSLRAGACGALKQSWHTITVESRFHMQNADR